MKHWAGAGAKQVTPWKARTVIFAVALLALTAWAASLTAPPMALYLVQTQDVPVLVLLCISIIVAVFWRPAWRLPECLPPNWMLLLAGLALSLLLWWGTYAVMGNFPLSRDEHMVVFDMAVFDSGRLAMPIPPEWRPYALSAVPQFLLNSNHPVGFVSAYLPINAMLRLAFSKAADPALYNPLLMLLGGVALLDITKRTFGPRDRACWVVLLVYALSAQSLVNAMTTYSMTGHLALNLVWLAAFLRGGKLWNSVAIFVGFLAIGLHELVFHPAFVAPFLLWKLRDGQWRLVFSYAAAYAAIGLWWIYYPMFVAPLVGGPAGHASKANFLTDQVIPTLLNRDPRTIPLMILNLLRLVAWQNLVLFPMLIGALPVALRQRGLARALLLGVVLWIAFLACVLPEQGRGWGYRYLNGYIGSFALLAGFGYRELSRRIGHEADGAVVLLSGVTAVAALPLLFTASYEFMQPRLAVEQLVARQRTPFVLIDSEMSNSADGRFRDTGDDFVRNLPDLSNRPLRFASDALDPGVLISLCKKAPITLITHRDMHAVGFMLNVSERSPKFETLVKTAARKAPECFRSAIIPGAADRGKGSG